MIITVIPNTLDRDMFIPTKPLPRSGFRNQKGTQRDDPEKRVYLIDKCHDSLTFHPNGTQEEMGKAISAPIWSRP